jgi:hypothetical protein
VFHLTQYNAVYGLAMAEGCVDQTFNDAISTIPDISHQSNDSDIGMNITFFLSRDRNRLGMSNILVQRITRL